MELIVGASELLTQINVSGRLIRNETAHPNYYPGVGAQ